MREISARVGWIFILSKQNFNVLPSVKYTELRKYYYNSIYRFQNKGLSFCQIETVWKFEMMLEDHNKAMLTDIKSVLFKVKEK